MLADNFFWELDVSSMLNLTGVHQSLRVKVNGIHLAEVKGVLELHYSLENVDQYVPASEVVLDDDCETQGLKDFIANQGWPDENSHL